MQHCRIWQGFHAHDNLETLFASTPAVRSCRIPYVHKSCASSSHISHTQMVFKQTWVLCIQRLYLLSHMSLARARLLQALV